MKEIVECAGRVCRADIEAPSTRRNERFFALVVWKTHVHQMALKAASNGESNDESLTSIFDSSPTLLR